MPPVMNRNEVQAPLAHRQPKASFAGAPTLSALRPADAGEQKGQNANVPVGSIAAIESLVGC